MSEQSSGSGGRMSLTEEYSRLLEERNALAARLAEEVESHAITAANLERLQNRWDKRPVVDDLQARLAEAERRIAEAPRMGITLRTNGGLDIKNIDELHLTVGQAGVYRLVFDGAADSAAEVQK
jgi:hypothetical protein